MPESLQSWKCIAGAQVALRPHKPHSKGLFEKRAAEGILLRPNKYGNNILVGEAVKATFLIQIKINLVQGFDLQRNGHGKQKWDFLHHCERRSSNSRSSDAYHQENNQNLKSLSLALQVQKVGKGRYLNLEKHFTR